MVRKLPLEMDTTKKTLKNMGTQATKGLVYNVTHTPNLQACLLFWYLWYTPATFAFHSSISSSSSSLSSQTFLVHMKLTHLHLRSIIIVTLIFFSHLSSSAVPFNVVFFSSSLRLASYFGASLFFQYFSALQYFSSFFYFVQDSFLLTLPLYSKHTQVIFFSAHLFCIPKIQLFASTNIFSSSVSRTRTLFLNFMVFLFSFLFSLVCYIFLKFCFS